MNLRRYSILFFLFFYYSIAFSQKDTLKEVIIYEYDTVYLKPDTIRITDTIIEISKIKPVKKKFGFSNLLSKTLFSSNSFLSPLTPNSISFNIGPFADGSFTNKIQTDSVSSQKVINKYFSLHWNYNIRKFVYSIGVGYTPYHEKQIYHNTYYASNMTINSEEQYDSLRINNDYTFDYYYNYINLYVLGGWEWKLNAKLHLSLNIGCVADYLLKYKQGSTFNSGSVIRKFDVSVVIAPNIRYLIANNIEIFLSPFYQRSLLVDNMYPNLSYQKIGIGMGFNLILK